MDVPKFIINGHNCVELSNDTDIKIVRVDLLVWETFKGAVPPNKKIRHIDGNKLNDRLDNLILIDK